MYYAGIDIGSLTAEAVVVKDGKVAAYSIINVLPNPVDSARAALGKALDKLGIGEDELSGTVSTGYGREKIEQEGMAQSNMSEISCHGYGAWRMEPSVRTIVDIGGQDAKVIKVGEKGNLDNFVMNDKCAAGAGRSMGIVAELVDVPLDSLGPLSLQAEDTVPISSVCVVFARSEILAYLREGVPKPTILAGACESLASRVRGLLKRVQIEPEFVISGGIAKNPGVVQRVEESLGLRAHIAEEPQIVGALGAALFARDRLQRKGRRRRRRRQKM